MENNKYNLECFITNLGKYNEGELIGEWVTLPVSQNELNDVFERIGISSEPDEFGNYYEEYFITDYSLEGPSALYDQLSEYTSIEKLQIVAYALEKINEMGDQAKETLEGLLEVMTDYMDALANTIEGNGIYMEGIEDNYDLGEYVFNEYYNGGEDFPRDKAEMYFDYEKFGQGARETHDAYNESTIQEYLGLDDFADDYEIGEAYLEQIYGGDLSSVEDINDFVDFEAFGRDIDLESQIVFTDNGAVDYTECQDDIGEDLYEELKGELIDKGILIDNTRTEKSYDEEER